MAHITAEAPPGGNPNYTILLVQHGIKPETRTDGDYETANECMEGIYKFYEEQLRTTYPNIPSVRWLRHPIPSVTCDISQSLEFVDQLVPLFCLVYQGTTNT